MIDYQDPIPPVLQLLNAGFKGQFNIYGNSFPGRVMLPAVLVRQTGGLGYYRLQILARANSDIVAMAALIDVMNFLERFAANIQGLRVLGCEKETNPISSTDTDSGIPEAWAYMRLEAAESNSLN
jgi:hypothetical protein